MMTVGCGSCTPIGQCQPMLGSGKWNNLSIHLLLLLTSASSGNHKVAPLSVLALTSLPCSPLRCLSGIQASCCCRPGWCICTFHSLPGGQVYTCLFVLHRICAAASFVLVIQKTTDNSSSGTRRGPKPRSVPPPLAPLAAVTSARKKQQTKPWQQTPFFSSTQQRLLFFEDLHGDAASSVSYLMPLPLSASLTPHLAQWGPCLGPR